LNTVPVNVMAAGAARAGAAHPSGSANDSASAARPMLRRNQDRRWGVIVGGSLLFVTHGREQVPALMGFSANIRAIFARDSSGRGVCLVSSLGVMFRIHADSLYHEAQKIVVTMSPHTSFYDNSVTKFTLLWGIRATVAYLSLLFAW